MAGKLAKAGYVPQGESDEVELWEENTQSWNFFMMVCGQMNYVAGFSSMKATGLRYEGIYPLLDRFFGDNKERWEEVFFDMQVLESAAVAEINRE